MKLNFKYLAFHFNTIIQQHEYVSRRAKTNIQKILIHTNFIVLSEICCFENYRTYNVANVREMLNNIVIKTAILS